MGSKSCLKAPWAGCGPSRCPSKGDFLLLTGAKGREKVMGLVRLLERQGWVQSARAPLGFGAKDPTKTALGVTLHVAFTSSEKSLCSGVFSWEAETPQKKRKAIII